MSLVACFLPFCLQGLVLDESITRVSPAAVKTLAMDVAFLQKYVEDLGNPALLENIAELLQSVALMQTDNHEEYYDISQRSKKYSRVDREAGVFLLEKYVHPFHTYPSHGPCTIHLLTVPFPLYLRSAS